MLGGIDNKDNYDSLMKQIKSVIADEIAIANKTSKCCSLRQTDHFRNVHPID